MSGRGKEPDLLGEWWVANPSDGPGEYELPDADERASGTLQEVVRDKFVLRTAGFVGSEPSAADDPVQATGRMRPEIWGIDRDARCYSLVDILRTKWTHSPGHPSGGHEDWSVGWLAKGNVWVNSDDECRAARIRVDHLNTWALYRSGDNIEYDGETATIDLRDRVLGSTMLGDLRVSLVRGSHTSFGMPGQDVGQRFSYLDDVYWQLEGPLVLRSIAKDWIGHFESFVRFMTMEPSAAIGSECFFDESAELGRRVELAVPRLERGSQEAHDGGQGTSPFKYLTTLRTLSDFGIEPMEAFAGYWREIVSGDSYMAMALHLESQDRLLSRGADGALLNAIRSVESLYAAHHPNTAVENISVQRKIDEAVQDAGDAGSQVVDAWPDLRGVGVLRREVAHGKARPSAGFGLRCLGGAMALQWIQRTRLLAKLGINSAAAQRIVMENYQYPWDLKTLRGWSAELGKASTESER